MYKDGAIFLQHNRDWKEWKANLVTNMIVKVSGSPFIHTQVYLRGYTYETAYPMGYRKFKGPGTTATQFGDVILAPIRDLTDEEVDAMIAFFDEKIEQKIKYGLFKLIVFLILGFTKPFWNLIKWTPFANDKYYGEFCSAGGDQAFKAGGMDILPGHLEEYTAPGDLLNSILHKKVS